MTNKTLQNLKDVFIPVPPVVEYVGGTKVEVRRNRVDGDDTVEKLPDKDQNNEVLADDNSSITSSTLEQGHVHRKLKNRHVQLIGIGGTIGVALFVSIANGLRNGGHSACSWESLYGVFRFWR
ncbi:CIC11C00000003402 [Sungouiella intermedia]|uniref:CIC11C00000003402 n=1 Tax=Sungouiella intermedia TaxID=45354 RepID=A0A1L0GKF2_9ASCO|nr:CIC11C00000003402 [[Candida] intermedia]